MKQQNSVQVYLHLIDNGCCTAITHNNIHLATYIYTRYEIFITILLNEAKR